ncbi:hypothetical protein HK096_003117 [Nowakowskiella sp. JEL0078]|nr:hypothetical protein HK096_003117 [Nowakowskiella sp. JEL0078]
MEIRTQRRSLATTLLLWLGATAVAMNLSPREFGFTRNPAFPLSPGVPVIVNNRKNPTVNQPKTFIDPQAAASSANPSTSTVSTVQENMESNSNSNTFINFGSPSSKSNDNISNSPQISASNFINVVGQISAQVSQSPSKTSSRTKSISSFTPTDTAYTSILAPIQQPSLSSSIDYSADDSKTYSLIASPTFAFVNPAQPTDAISQSNSKTLAEIADDPPLASNFYNTTWLSTFGKRLVWQVSPSAGTEVEDFGDGCVDLNYTGSKISKSLNRIALFSVQDLLNASNASCNINLEMRLMKIQRTSIHNTSLVAALVYVPSDLFESNTTFSAELTNMFWSGSDGFSFPFAVVFSLSDFTQIRGHLTMGIGALDPLDIVASPWSSIAKIKSHPSLALSESQLSEIRGGKSGLGLRAFSTIWNITLYISSNSNKSSWPIVLQFFVSIFAVLLLIWIPTYIYLQRRRHIIETQANRNPDLKPKTVNPSLLNYIPLVTFSPDLAAALLCNPATSIDVTDTSLTQNPQILRSLQQKRISKGPHSISATLDLSGSRHTSVNNWTNSEDNRLSRISTQSMQSLVVIRNIGPDKDDEEKDEVPACAVCIEDFVLGNILRVLACSHVFHRECVDTWLTTRSVLCPLCRLDVLSGLIKSEDNNKKLGVVVKDPFEVIVDPFTENV